MRSLVSSKANECTGPSHTHRQGNQGNRNIRRSSPLPFLKIHELIQHGRRPKTGSSLGSLTIHRNTMPGPRAPPQAPPQALQAPPPPISQIEVKIGPREAKLGARRAQERPGRSQNEAKMEPKEALEPLRKTLKNVPPGGHRFGPQNGPQNGSKSSPKLAPFLDLFLVQFRGRF